MSNLYELFEVMSSASKKEIIGAYENKITKFNNCSKLSDEQIYEIKMLKIGLYVLINPELRQKYDISMGIKKNNSSEPNAVNDNLESNLDSLFSVDNSWMKNVNVESNGKKTRVDTNIGARVFSLSDMNQRPGYSSDFEASLRKPQQGREDKSNQMVNKNKM